MNIDWDDIGVSFEELLSDMPELEHLCFSDQSDDPYGISMLHAAALILILQAAKDAQYGASWAKNGEFGVMLNYKRKEDRLDRLCAVATCLDDEDHQVALIDTLVDRSSYGMMWLSNASKNRPHAFQQWLKEQWCVATGISFNDIAEILGLEE